MNDKANHNEPEAAALLARRILKWEGTRNTRDLGGYMTTSGRSIRWRRLLRSDHLQHLTTADQAALLQLNLYALVDLRSPAERAEAPNNLPADAPFRQIELPIYDKNRPDGIAKIGARIRKGRLADFDSEAYLLASYRFYVRRHAATAGRLTRLLLEAGGRPILFHCTSGKDRTGFIAAVLLLLLGVPANQVMDDYLLTNQVITPGQAPFLQRYADLFGPAAAAQVKTLSQVQAQFLEAGLAAINEEFGSFEQFVRRGLALTADDVDQLRRDYLES